MKTRLLTFFPESQQARQFTPLREGRRPCPHQHCSRSCYFNSRPSARGDRNRLHRLMQREYFNSRPSARGDGWRILQRPRRDVISIHAPPRGATAWGWSTAHSATFQFTPLREGRPRKSTSFSATKNFNSRPSARGDKRQENNTQNGRDFNSRPSARGDVEIKIIHNCTFEFQFTPLREGRQRDIDRCELYSKFQFTPLREGRLEPRESLGKDGIFQFTPLREGRLPPPHDAAPRQRISIHAPPRGATKSSSAA